MAGKLTCIILGMDKSERNILSSNVTMAGFTGRKVLLTRVCLKCMRLISIRLSIDNQIYQMVHRLVVAFIPEAIS